jgi:glutamate/aspartate transport system permease protein
MINVFKNSAVASTIGLLELSAQAQQLVDYTAHPYESFAAATAVYISINVIVVLIMRQVEVSVRLPGYIGGK